MMRLYFAKVLAYILLSFALAFVFGLVFHISTATGLNYFNPMLYTGIAIFTILGLLFLGKSYQKNPGIAINPNWAGYTVDVISVIFLSAAAYCIVAFLVYLAYEAEIYICNEEAARVVTAFMFLPSVAILVFVSLNMSSQSVVVDENGITIYYPDNHTSVKWQEISKVGLRDSQSFVSRDMGAENIVMPRKIQTLMSIETKDKGVVELFEPTKNRKKRMMLLLKQFAPENLLEDINTIEKEW